MKVHVVENQPPVVVSSCTVGNRTHQTLSPTWSQLTLRERKLARKMMAEQGIQLCTCKVDDECQLHRVFYAKLVGSFLTGFPPAFQGMYVFAVKAKTASEAHMKIWREYGWTDMFAYHRADDLD